MVTAFELHEMIKKHSSKSGSLDGISRTLINTAQQRYSKDNITVIVLAFLR